MSLRDEQVYARQVLGISPDRMFEVVAPVILTGAGFSLWNGIVALTADQMIFASAPGFLSTGRSIGVRYSDVVTFSWQRESCRVAFVEQGRVQQIDLTVLAGESAEEWCRFGLMGKLRLLKIPGEGEPWPHLLQVVLPGELAVRALSELDRHSEGLREFPLYRTWKAFLLLHLGRAEEAGAILAKDSESLGGLGCRLRAQMLLQTGDPALAALLASATGRSEPFDLRFEKMCQVRAGNWETALLLHAPGLTGLTSAFRMAGAERLALFQAVADLTFPTWIDQQAFLCSPRAALTDFWLELLLDNVSGAERCWESCRDDRGLSMEQRARLEAALAWTNQDFLRAYHLLRGIREPGLQHLIWVSAVKAGCEAEQADAGQAWEPKTSEDRLLRMSVLVWMSEPAGIPAELFAAGECECWPVRSRAWAALYRCRMLLRKQLLEEGCREFAHVQRLLRLHTETVSGTHPLEALFDHQLLQAQADLLGAEVEVLRASPDKALGYLGAVEPFVRSFGGWREKELLESVKERAQRLLEQDLLGDTLRKNDLSFLGEWSGILSLRRILTFLATKIRAGFDDVRLDARPAAGDQEVISSLESLRRRSEEPLMVAVVGEFNAGKSTLLNAWLGKDILPTGIRPTTALPCVVRFGETSAARIAYDDDSFEAVLPENLRRYVDEGAKTGEKPETNGRSPTHVELFLPVDELKNVWLVDTPGLNSLTAGHAEITTGFLQRADAFIWVVDATQLGRASEQEAQRELLPANAPVVFVLNRMDEIAPEERKDVEVEGAAFFSAPAGTVFPVSAREALLARVGDKAVEPWLPAFERLVTHLRDEVFQRFLALKLAGLREKTMMVLRDLESLGKTREQSDLEEMERVQACGEAILAEINDGLSIRWPEEFRERAGYLERAWEAAMAMHLPAGTEGEGLGRRLPLGFEAVLRNPVRDFLTCRWSWLEGRLTVFLGAVRGLLPRETSEESVLLRSALLIMKSWEDHVTGKAVTALERAFYQAALEMRVMPGVPQIRGMLGEVPGFWRSLGPEIEDWIRQSSFLARSTRRKRLARWNAEVIRPAVRLLACLEES